MTNDYTQISEAAKALLVSEFFSRDFLHLAMINNDRTQNSLNYVVSRIIYMSRRKCRKHGLNPEKITVGEFISRDFHSYILKNEEYAWGKSTRKFYIEVLSKFGLYKHTNNLTVTAKRLLEEVHS